MKIEESKVACTKQLHQIPAGDCFVIEKCYFMKTSSHISTDCTCVNLDTGHVSLVDENIYVCPVDATVVINKVGE